MIDLRSATELVYSASGDPALATTLRKCAVRGKQGERFSRADASSAKQTPAI